jgi:hypothetical protein
MASQRRGGERRILVRGAVVSSGGRRCSDGGAHRWPEVALNGKAAGLVLRRFLAMDSGSAAGSRGSEAHESGAGWLALRRLEQRSVVMREQRRTARAEWSGRHSAPIAGRGEMAAPMNRQCDRVRHGRVEQTWRLVGSVSVRWR